MADSEGIEPPPTCAGLVFETNVTNQHLPTIHENWRMWEDSNLRADLRRPLAFQASAIVHSTTHPKQRNFI